MNIIKAKLLHMLKSWLLYITFFSFFIFFAYHILIHMPIVNIFEVNVMWHKHSDWQAKIPVLCIKKPKLIAVFSVVFTSFPPPSKMSCTKTSFHTHPLNWIMIGNYYSMVLSYWQINHIDIKTLKKMHL